MSIAEELVVERMEVFNTQRGDYVLHCGRREADRYQAELHLDQVTMETMGLVPSLELLGQRLEFLVMSRNDTQPREGGFDSIFRHASKTEEIGRRGEQTVRYRASFESPCSGGIGFAAIYEVPFHWLSLDLTAEEYENLAFETSLSGRFRVFISPTGKRGHVIKLAELD